MRTVRALWGATHPGPSVVVTVLSLALGIAAGLDAAHLILLVVAVFAGQLSVGLSNDAIDLFRDATVGRSDKPLVRGDTRLRTAWIAALLTLFTAVILSAVLGWGMLLAHVIALAFAWSYNAGLKATPASILPFLISFGIFPSLASLSAAVPEPAPVWAALAGAALGAAVHLTNVLPDLGDDRRTGVRGLPHRIGPAASVMLAVIGIVVAAIAVLIGSLIEGAAPIVMIPFAAVVTAIAAAVMIRMRRRGPDRTGFRLVMAAALVLALQLVVASGTS